MPESDASDSGNHLYDHTAFWLHRLSTSVLSRFEASLADFGVTAAQWKVMLILHHNDAPNTFAVASMIGVDAGSVTRTIDRLIAKGLVARNPSLEDRRAVNLTLTETGEQLLHEHLLPIADVQDNLWLETLSRAELLTFKSLLARLLDAQGIETPERWNRSGLCTEPH